MRLTIALLLALITLPLAAQSITPQQNAKIKHLERKLMAPCCYTQTISEHMSREAEQMREEVTQMVLAGKSEQEIIDYYKAKYGDIILVVPDGNSGIVLFTAPYLFLILGAIALVLLLRLAIRRRKAALQPITLHALDPQWLAMRDRIRAEIGE